MALRREFERTLFERYGQPPGQDPVLAALFHATAVQLARVYAEAEQVFPEAVFDDLVAGLGMSGRTARAAQTVIGFTGATSPELVTPDTPLAGATGRGEQVAFALDVPLRVGPARLVFAGVAEGGRLHVVPGATLPDDPAAAGPTMPLSPAVVPLAADDAPCPPTLFLAVDVDRAPATHLGSMGMFLDVQGADDRVVRALGRATWQLLGSADAVDAADAPADAAGTGRATFGRLLLRARTGPGGCRLLEWNRDDASTASTASTASGARAADGADLATASPTPAAAYGPLCWRWPEVPPQLRARGAPPRAVAAVLADALPIGFAHRYDRPLAWIEVALPAGTRGLAAALQRVVVHAAPARNLEPFAERIPIVDLGAAVAFRPEGMRTRHLVAVLGITGEQGEPYADEADPAAGAGRGRYRVRGGDLELRPAVGPTGTTDRYVMARLLYTDGARANGLQPGDVTARLARADYAATNLVVSRGGGAPPAYAPAKARFADALRTRERVVTPADVDAVARAFEPRVAGAVVRAATETGADGVPQRVEVVTATARAADFADPAAELPALAAALERHLTARAPLGTVIRVVVQPIDGERPPATAEAR